MIEVIVYLFAVIGVVVTVAGLWLYFTTPSEEEMMRQQDAEPEPFDLEDKKESCRPADIRRTVH